MGDKMSDETKTLQPSEKAEVVEDKSDREVGDAIEQPAKVMRLGAMLRSLLEEVRETPLDNRSRDRLRDVYETSVNELGSALSTDLREELGRLAPPFEEGTPSTAELRVAKAQIVGWLEGLVQGIQATLYAQQVFARRQLADMRGQLPSATQPISKQASEDVAHRGTYL